MGWKIEVYKAALCILFPLGVFTVYNNRGFYESAILEARRLEAARSDKEETAKLKAVIEELKMKKMDADLQRIKSSIEE